MNGLEEHPLLLVVGASPAANRDLLQRLIAQTASSGGPAPNTDGSELTLDNKYYTARVRVGLATPDQMASPAAAVEHEAQILVFAASSEASFDAVRTWAHSSGSTEGGENEPDIKLCVATTTEALSRDGGADVQQQPHWLVASRQWASDNYYEFVEVSNVGTNGDALRGPDGDLQGVARILEALQAHQWPGLHRKEPPAVGRALHAADAQQPHGQLTDDLSDSRPASGEPHGAPAAADAPAENGFLQGSDVLAFREFLASDDAAAGTLPLDEADEQEGRFDQLMAAFAGSRQRLQQLPDSQRRDAAESMALQMMEAFGLDDTSGSDSSDDELHHEETQ